MSEKPSEATQRMAETLGAEWQSHERTQPEQPADLVRTASRAVHEYLCHRGIMEYLDNDEDCEGIAKAVLAAIPTAEWQDIATAPMDGSWIITAKIGWHHSSDRIKIEMWDHPKNRYDVWHCSRAQFNGKYWTDGIERLVEPTHWMPLITPDPVKGPQGCAVPPRGWYCTREAGHDGPCAAIPVADALPPGTTPTPQPTASQERAQIVAFMRDDIEVLRASREIVRESLIAEAIDELADCIERGDDQQETK